MPQSPETAVQAADPAKHWKQLLWPPTKLGLFRPILMRGFIAICAMAAISVCYFAPPIHKWRIACPECDQSLVTATYHRLDAGGGGGDTPTTDLSHILFGVGGSAETWGTRRQYCELWWRPGVTRGFVWLDKEPESGGKRWPETSPPYKVSADTSKFKYTNWYGSRSAVRIARIVKESFELGLGAVRWFVMGDDDTVFFTENLVAVLNKYDHRQMYYIGSVSESVEQDLVHSYTMGYGGAGFAISYPLAAELVRILDGCIDRYADFYGSDQKVGGCVAEIGVPLTRELGFHQMDIRGNPIGMLSAHPLSPLVSLHHLDYLQPLFPSMSRAESVRRLIGAYDADPGRVLQHSFCYDLRRNWSISVSWGYNVRLYPFLLTARDLSTPLQTFLTWGSWHPEPFTFNTRPLSMNPCKRAVIFYFDGGAAVEDGNTTTSYRKIKDPEQNAKCDREDYAAVYAVNGFNITAADLDSRVLNKKQAPRRQCCEVTSGLHQPDGVVLLTVRDCRRSESVTPP